MTEWRRSGIDQRNRPVGKQRFPPTQFSLLATGTFAQVQAHQCLNKLRPVRLPSFIVFANRVGVDAEGRAASNKVQGAVSIGEKPVITNAHETSRQNVLKKTSDELIDIESHHFLAPAVAIVSPLESNATVFHGNQPVVGNSDAMGVAREIIENVPRAAKGGLGKNNPLDLAAFLQKAFETFGLGKFQNLTVELELPFVESIVEGFEEKSPVQAREDLDREQETLAAGAPFVGALRLAALFGRRQSASRHDAVDVRMVGHGLSPGVQDRHQSDTSAKVFWVGRDGQERSRGGAKEKAVDNALVLES